MKERYCIIMAGGIGSRFWPLSKNNCPKQFLDILGLGKSFIRSTFERFLPVVPAEHFLVVTNAAYRQMVMEHLPELRPDQVLCEPMRRNTAPCLAYANHHILAQCPDASIVVTPSDALVTNEAEFQRVIRVGMDFVEEPANHDALLTIGIKPSRPETGYGYININNGEAGEVKSVVAFKEKPNLETAKGYLADGNYMWNAGIFIWSLQGIRAAYRQFLPEMEQLFDQGQDKFGTPEEQDFINHIFPQCENISIDYGVMERAQRRYTIPADFGWSDIGTWGSLYEHTAHDEWQNSVQGHAALQDTHHTVVNIEEGYEAVVQGLDNYLVALRGHSLLVCRLQDEQDIKHWIEKL